MSIRVFIIDDHAIVRTGMRMILSAQTDIEVVGEADSGEHALPQLRALAPDVVLCDLHLPGLSGLEVTDRIGLRRQGGRSERTATGDPRRLARQEVPRPGGGAEPRLSRDRRRQLALR